jgi:hypothetical protein
LLNIRSLDPTVVDCRGPLFYDASFPNSSSRLNAQLTRVFKGEARGMLDHINQGPFNGGLLIFIFPSSRKTTRTFNGLQTPLMRFSLLPRCCLPLAVSTLTLVYWEIAGILGETFHSLPPPLNSTSSR